MLRPHSRADRRLSDDMWDCAAAAVALSLAGVGLLAILLWVMFW